jgi:hypothetical protein
MNNGLFTAVHVPYGVKSVSGVRAPRNGQVFDRTLHIAENPASRPEYACTDRDGHKAAETPAA